MTINKRQLTGGLGEVIAAKRDEASANFHKRMQNSQAHFAATGKCMHDREPLSPPRHVEEDLPHDPVDLMSAFEAALDALEEEPSPSAVETCHENDVDNAAPKEGNPSYSDLGPAAWELSCFPPIGVGHTLLRLYDTPP